MDDALQVVQKLHPVARAVDEVNNAHLFIGLRVGLRRAAAHGHHRVRVQGAGAVDLLAGLGVAEGGYGAGVDDVGVRRIGKGHQFVPPLAQDGLHGLGLILIDFAAQSVYGNSHVIPPVFIDDAIIAFSGISVKKEKPGRARIKRYSKIAETPLQSAGHMIK